MSRISVTAFAIALAASAAVSQARPGWTEVGDAGYVFDGTGAQPTVGSGLITTITGSLAAPGATTYNELMDAYQIIIKDPTTFRATLNSAIDPAASIVGSGDFAGTDSRLYLFDSSGTPLLMADDSGSALTSTLGTPLSYAASGAGGAVTAQASTVNIVAGGTYWLVIGGYDASPCDAAFNSVLEQPGLDTASFKDLGGPIAGSAPASVWAGAFDANTFDYTVALRGASFSTGGGATPEPASLALLTLAGAGLVRRRRAH